MNMNKEYIIETSMSVEQAIDKIKINTYLTNVNDFFPFFKTNQSIPFYGQVTENSFTLHTSSSMFSHQYMALDGNVYNDVDSTKIQLFKRGLSFAGNLSVLSIILTYILMVLFLNRFTDIPIYLPIIMFSIVAVATPFVYILNSRVFIKRAINDLENIFEDKEQ